MPEFSPAESCKTIVTGNAALSGYTLIVGHGLPDTDKLITFLDTGGEPSNPKWLLDFPTVQVVVRGGANDYKNIWSVAKALKDLLLVITSQPINGDELVSITEVSTVAFIGRDDNHRPMFSVNFRLIIQPQTNAQTNRTALSA